MESSLVVGPDDATSDSGHHGHVAYVTVSVRRLLQPPQRKTVKLSLAGADAPWQDRLKGEIAQAFGACSIRVREMVVCLTDTDYVVVSEPLGHGLVPVN